MFNQKLISPLLDQLKVMVIDPPSSVLRCISVFWRPVRPGDDLMAVGCDGDQQKQPGWRFVQVNWPAGLSLPW